MVGPFSCVVVRRVVVVQDLSADSLITNLVGDPYGRHRAGAGCRRQQDDRDQMLYIVNNLSEVTATRVGRHRCKTEAFTVPLHARVEVLRSYGPQVLKLLLQYYLRKLSRGKLAPERTVVSAYYRT